MGPLAWLRRVRDQGVTEHTPARDIKHIRLTNVAAMMAAVMILPWAPVNLMLANWMLAIPVLIGGVLVLCVFPLNRTGRHLAAGMMLMLVGLIQTCWGIWMYGMAANIWVYLILMVYFPYFLFLARHRMVAHGFSAFSTLLTMLFLLFKEHFPGQVSLLPEKWQVLINGSITVIAIAVMAAATRAMVDKSEQALTAETARADSLLLNVLPVSIASRLKKAPATTIADHHQEISVLFADIVGFTPLSARLGADRTVKILNRVFTAFDEICDRNGVEKVRTIGDGYMVVAGAPEPRVDHASALARVALEMREFMQTAAMLESLQVRIGINSGEAVAGIVGTSRFHYDLWGDAVNIAARMESLGVPSRIQVAEPTWRRIRDNFVCQPRGTIDVKGKGAMPTWFVESSLMDLEQQIS